MTIQYEIIYSESFIPEAQAQAILAKQAQRTTISTSSQQDLQTQEHVHNDEELEPESKDTYERMMFEDIPHLCTIPYVAPPEADNTTKSEEEQQQELIRASDHGWELLQGMKEQSCLYYAAGWWVYSFCYNEGIRQFHPLPPGRGGIPLFPPQEDESIASFTLGKFEHPSKPSTSPESVTSATDSSSESSATTDPSTKDVAAPATPIPPPTTLRTRGSTSYLTQSLTGGTKCDLTGRPRRIEVQFHCNPSKTDHISMIKETASCVYLMVIHTPRLCNDVAFLPQQIDKPNPITCQEIVGQDGVEEWKAWKETVMRERLLEIEVSGESQMQMPGIEGDTKVVSPPLVIGGIEVGAQRLVGGTPERTIKVSNIVSNQHKSGKDDKFLATLARFDGKDVTVMSDKDVDKLGMKGVKEEAAKYRKKLEGSGHKTGVPWKLELWTTPSGEEFRMFLGSEDPEEEAARREGRELVKKEEKKEAKEEPEGSEEEYKESN